MPSQRNAAGAFFGIWLLSTWALGEPPLCTTHFFDWYVVNESRRSISSNVIGRIASIGRPSHRSGGDRKQRALLRSAVSQDT